MANIASSTAGSSSVPSIPSIPSGTPATDASAVKPRISGHQAAMALFPKARRASAVGMTVMLLGGTAAAFTPPFLATREVKRFCGQATVGTPRAELQEKAEVANYLVKPLSSGSLLIEPTGSLGRAFCVMRFDDKDRLASTVLGD